MYNVTNPINQRVVSVNVLCNKCDVPKYLPLDTTQMYRIIVQSHLVDGGQGFDIFPKFGQNHRLVECHTFLFGLIV